jgi:hypothetical protein
VSGYFGWGAAVGYCDHRTNSQGEGGIVVSESIVSGNCFIGASWCRSCEMMSLSAWFPRPIIRVRVSGSGAVLGVCSIRICVCNGLCLVGRSPLGGRLASTGRGLSLAVAVGCRRGMHAHGGVCTVVMRRLEVFRIWPWGVLCGLPGERIWSWGVLCGLPGERVFARLSYCVSWRFK